MSRSNLIVQLNEDIKESRICLKAGDPELLKIIQAILQERPAYGYRRITTLLNGKLRSQGCATVNHKRVYRIMKRNKLLLTKAISKPKRAHTGKVETLLSNTRWCSDSFSIQCWNGDQVYVAFSMDTCDREVMRYIASTIGIDGQAIRDLMLETVEYRFGAVEVPWSLQWLSDNGSCYTARETVAFGRQLGLDIRTTPPYAQKVMEWRRLLLRLLREIT